MSITCKDIKFSYFEESKNILDQITETFDREKITLLTGASGCGKSTLLYLLAGIYPQNAGVLKSGEVSVEGQDPAKLAPPQRCKLVGMMFQNPELQFCMDTVKNELIFCLENVGADPGEMDELIDEALAFCGISHLKEQKLIHLSGGEKQKVMLASFVMLRPAWLLLDEPFANIDDVSARDIAGKLKQLHDQFHMGILAVDHRLENWTQVGDIIRIMDQGAITDEVMDMKNLNRGRLEDLGIIVPGGSYPSIMKKRAESTPVLELRNVSLKRGTKMILQDISVSFSPGCIYAIVGESGCGKTSLFGAISGLYPYQGEIRLEEKNYRPGKKAHLGKIGFVTQSPQDQFVADTVREEILISLQKSQDKEESCEKILRSIKLWRYRDVSAYLLSQGQQRRLGVAALMAYHCRILLCDEPTYAQDRKNTIAIMEGLCAQARERKVALIFSTHDHALARDYADKVLELRGGRLYEKMESHC